MKGGRNWRVERWQEPLKQFYRQDIAPAAKTVSDRLRGALDDIQKIFALTSRGEPARKGAGMLREMGSEIDQRRDQAVAALDGFREHFYRDAPKEHGVFGLEVYDAIETGQLGGLSPADRAFADTARKLFDARHKELTELGLVKSYIENYPPREYKNSDEAARWIANWQRKRPLAGSEDFRKQRKSFNRSRRSHTAHHRPNSVKKVANTV